MITYDIVDVAPQRAQELIEAGWYVLDVRTEAEWTEGRIAGSNHLPIAEVVSGLGSRVPEPTLLVTESGRGRVGEYLKHQGIEVANLEGGFFAWEAAGLSVER